MRSEEIQRMRRAQDDHWWYRGRRDFFRALLEAHRIEWGDIAEIGCGTGANLGWLSELGPVTGADRSPECLRLAADFPHEKLVEADATRLPLPDAAFGLVCLLDALEHIEDDRAALMEAWRILRPGGRLLVSVPAYASLYAAHDRAQGHFRRYERDPFQKLMQETGGKFLFLTGWNRRLLPPIALARWASKTMLKTGLIKEPSSRLELTTPPAPINRLLGGVLARDSARALQRGLAARGGWGEETGLSWVALVEKNS